MNKEKKAKMLSELGKWLMDVAKFMATVLVISSAVTDLSNKMAMIIVIIVTASILLIGLYMVTENSTTDAKPSNNKRTNNNRRN